MAYNSNQTGAQRDSITPTLEKGIAIKLTNKTGSASVKGTVVHLDLTVEEAFDLQSSAFDSIGIVYEDGIADGSECLVVISGVAEVLIEDGTTATVGYWVRSSDVDGRADATNANPPGGTIQALETHSQEIGHCLQTKASGTDVLVKINLHFN